MRVSFSSLPVGARFHDGKNKGVGALSDVTYWREWQKQTKSKALCIATPGYGNTRFVGALNSFAPNAVVWKLD